MIGVIICNNLHLGDSLGMTFFRSVRVAARVSASVPFMVNDIPSSAWTAFYLSIRHLIGIQVVSSFWLFQVTLLQTFTYKHVCGRMFSCLPSRHPGAGLRVTW